MDKFSHTFIIFHNIFWTYFHYIYLIFFIDGNSTNISKYTQVEFAGEKRQTNNIPNEIVNIEKTKFPKNCTLCLNSPPKFDQSSHCTNCEACILRRDHHCNWIGKCVGFYNNSAFVRLLIWVLVSINYLSINCNIIFLIITYNF